MLQEKLFHVNKKVDVVQKKIFNDKKNKMILHKKNKQHFALKKVINFFWNDTPYSIFQRI